MFVERHKKRNVSQSNDVKQVDISYEGIPREKKEERLSQNKSST